MYDFGMLGNSIPDAFGEIENLSKMQKRFEP
jgi:hypothetical protein